MNISLREWYGNFMLFKEFIDLKSHYMGTLGTGTALHENEDGLYMCGFSDSGFGRSSSIAKIDSALNMDKKELKKLRKEVQNVGLTIIPLKLFITDKGWAKLKIGLCKGKKLYDKRQVLKDRDNKKSLDRLKKNYS